MATIIQVTLRTVDNIPENFVTNQFCVSGDVELGSDMVSMRLAIQAFYNALRPAAYPATIAQNDHIIKYYLAGGPAPNYPYFEDTFPFTTAPSGTALPSEVALCLSFQGDRSAGLPQARRRGRVFIGPLVTTCNNNGRPGPAIKTAMLAAAEAFFDDVDVIPSAGNWAVWSTVNGAPVILVNAWVDDAFDTQRSRGVGVTSRETVSFV